MRISWWRWRISICVRRISGSWWCIRGKGLNRFAGLRVETQRHEDAKTRSFFKRKVANKGKCFQPFERIEPLKQFSTRIILTQRHEDSKARSFFRARNRIWMKKKVKTENTSNFLNALNLLNLWNISNKKNRLKILRRF